MSRWLRVAVERQSRNIVVTKPSELFKDSEDIIKRYKFLIPIGDDDIKYPTDEYVDNYIKSRHSGEGINWYDESEYNDKLELKKQKEEEIKKLWKSPEGEWIWKNYKEYKEAGDWLTDQSNPEHYNDEYAMQDAWHNDPAYSNAKDDRDIAYDNLIDCLIETTNPIFQKFLEEKLGTTKEKAKQYKK